MEPEPGGTPAPDAYGEAWAEIYDEDHALMVPPDAQLSVLAELAGDGRALELGIGTGRVALPLAARGVEVSGIDASTSMVERLRAKPGGQRVPVAIGNMADLPVEGTFQLVYVVFNTLFALLTQRAQVACFRRVAQVLEPSGTFLIECFVPDLGRFDRGQTLRTVSVDERKVRLDATRHDAAAQQVDTSVISISSGSISLRPVRLRYAWPAELDLMAELAGLRLRSRWSGWDRAAFPGNSGMHVSVYGPSA